MDFWTLFLSFCGQTRLEADRQHMPPAMQPDSYSSRYDLPSKEHSAWHDEQCPRYQYGLSFSLSNPGALSGGNARAPLKPPLPVWSSPNGPPTAGSFMTGSRIVDLRGSCSLSTSICAPSSLIDGERSVVSFFVRLGVSSYLEVSIVGTRVPRPSRLIWIADHGTGWRFAPSFSATTAYSIFPLCVSMIKLSNVPIFVPF